MSAAWRRLLMIALPLALIVGLACALWSRPFADGDQPGKHPVQDPHGAAAPQDPAKASSTPPAPEGSSSAAPETAEAMALPPLILAVSGDGQPLAGAIAVVLGLPSSKRPELLCSQEDGRLEVGPLPAGTELGLGCFGYRTHFLRSPPSPPAQPLPITLQPAPRFRMLAASVPPAERPLRMEVLTEALLSWPEHRRTHDGLHSWMTMPKRAMGAYRAYLDAEDVVFSADPGTEMTIFLMREDGVRYLIWTGTLDAKGLTLRYEAFTTR